MLRFNQYITEQEDLTIDAPQQLSVDQIDILNSDLDSVTEKPFINSAVFMNAVRGTLERYGIIIPPGYEIPMLSLDAETAYALSESELYVYVVHNTEEDGVIGYAQVVNKEDLDDLMSTTTTDDERIIPNKSWIPPARRDDDSGNSIEYA